MVKKPVSARWLYVQYQKLLKRATALSFHEFFSAPNFWYGIILCIMIFPPGIRTVKAQTFDEAINNQLAARTLGQDALGCARLVGNTPRDPASGQPIGFGPQLAAICGGFSLPSGSSFGPNASGGSGGTPVTGGVEKRLKEIREEEKKAATRFSLYLTAPNYENLDRDTTKYEDGYDSHILGGTLGADVLINNLWVVGMAFDYKSWDGDFNNGGNFDTDIYSPIVYASFFPLAGFFTDVFLGYSWKDASSDRARTYTNEAGTMFGGKESGDPDADEFKFGLSMGYDYPIRQFTIGPRLALNYVSTDFDSYAEKGKNGDTGLELKFDKDSRVSFQSKLGMQASMAISTAFGVVVPQINGNWIHEYSDNQRSISVQFVQDYRDNPAKFSFQTPKPDRDFYEVSAGLLFALPHGIQTFANYRILLGNEYFDSQFATAGIRVEF